MIRRALATDIPDSGNDESLIRICALKKAYGCDVSFIQYFTDDDEGFLSVMDGVGVLYAPAITDELQVFLSMNPDIHTLHCPGAIGQALLESGDWQGRVGDVLLYNGPLVSQDPSVCTSPYLPDVYALLQENFPHVAPLDYWYPDVSHRVRHDCCHIACIIRDNRVISTAMTVAETDSAAILGQIATAPAFRRQGMAAACIKSILSACKDKQLYILPITEQAAHLYRSLGFTPCGSWAELQKIH